MTRKESVASPTPRVTYTLECNRCHNRSTHQLRLITVRTDGGLDALIRQLAHYAEHHATCQVLPMRTAEGFNEGGGEHQGPQGFQGFTR